MSNSVPQSLRVTLGDNLGNAGISVEFEAFIRFDLWLDHELDSLRSRFADLASPEAQHPRSGNWHRPQQPK